MASDFQKRFARTIGETNLIRKQLTQDASGDYPTSGPISELPPQLLIPQADPLAPGTLPKQPVKTIMYAKGGSRDGSRGQSTISHMRIYIGGSPNQSERVRILSEDNNMAAAHFIKWYRQYKDIQEPRVGRHSHQYWIREMIPNKTHSKYKFAGDADWYEGTWTPIIENNKQNLKLTDEFGIKQTPEYKFSVYFIGKSNNDIDRRTFQTGTFLKN